MAARRPARSSVLPPSWRRPCWLIPAVSFPLIRCYLALPPACRVAYLPMPGHRALCSTMSMRSSPRAEVRPRRCQAPCPEKEIVGFICQHSSPPRHLRLFYELCAYIKSGSPPEGLFPPGPAHSRRSSYTGVSGVQNGVRISWRHGVPTGAQGRDLPGRLACVSRNHLRACSSAVGPMQWPRCVA